jgi:hypothetical protein
MKIADGQAGIHLTPPLNTSRTVKGQKSKTVPTPLHCLEVSDHIHVPLALPLVTFV